MKLFNILFASVLMMCLEFTQIRVIGFSHWFQFAYFTITLALLGFAAGGTLLAVVPRLQNCDWRILTSASYVGFAITAWMAYFFSVSVVPNAVHLTYQIYQGVYRDALSVYFPMVLLLFFPYVFISLIVCRLIRDSKKQAALAYGINLIGTAVGCGVFVLLIGVLGAYSLMYFLMILALGLALIYVRHKWVLVMALLALIVFCASGMIKPEWYFLPKVDPSKNIHGYQSYPDNVIDTQWTPMFRVDLVRADHGAVITLDGDAQSHVMKLSPEMMNDQALYYDQVLFGRHSAFRLIQDKEEKRVLIIGSGGGTDVFAAYKHGFGHIDAVDINWVAKDWLTGKHKDALLGLYDKPNVHLFTGDGREFLTRKRAPYDVILMYSVDTLAGYYTGAYTLTENYLYTSEAFSEYFDALSPEGVLQVSRNSWGNIANVQKLFATAATLLDRVGKDPNDHLFVARVEDYFDFLISKKPFERVHIEDLIQKYREYGGEKARIVYAGLKLSEEPQLVTGILAAMKDDRLATFYANKQIDVSPATDDHPFFFENRKWDQILKGLFLFKSASRLHNWSGFLLSLILIVAAGVTGLLMLVAYFWSPERMVPSLAFKSGAYFLCIGMGYMFFQMTLIQRFVLLLSHPVYAMAAVIPTVLCAMGVGSMVASGTWFQKRQTAGWAVLTPLLALVLWEYGLWPYLLSLRRLQLEVSSWAALLMAWIVSMPLGFCFPLGLRLVAYAQLKSFVPFAWTANACASVLGSALAMLVSLALGFSVTMNFAIGLYALGLGVYVFAVVRRSQAHNEKDGEEINYIDNFDRLTKS